MSVRIQSEKLRKRKQKKREDYVRVNKVRRMIALIFHLHICMDCLFYFK